MDIAEEYFAFKDKNLIVTNALLTQLKSYRDPLLIAEFEKEDADETTIELYLKDKKKYLTK